MSSKPYKMRPVKNVSRKTYRWSFASLVRERAKSERGEGVNRRREESGMTKERRANDFLQTIPSNRIGYH